MVTWLLVWVYDRVYGTTTGSTTTTTHTTTSSSCGEHKQIGVNPDITITIPSGPLIRGAEPNQLFALSIDSRKDKNLEDSKSIAGSGITSYEEIEYYSRNNTDFQTDDDGVVSRGRLHIKMR
ncbi:MAG TPA: hypothetical protein VFI73_09525 [Candidatus Nitrosopolaris sp.]|nr:hypothetical protein [Candidatus Nitrosopolaris sp.]